MASFWPRWPAGKGDAQAAPPLPQRHLGLLRWQPAAAWTDSQAIQREAEAARLGQTVMAGGTVTNHETRLISASRDSDRLEDGVMYRCAGRRLNGWRDLMLSYLFKGRFFYYDEWERRDASHAVCLCIEFILSCQVKWNICAFLVIYIWQTFEGGDWNDFYCSVGRIPHCIHRSENLLPILCTSVFRHQM